MSQQRLANEILADFHKNINTDKGYFILKPEVTVRMAEPVEFSSVLFYYISSLRTIIQLQCSSPSHQPALSSGSAEPQEQGSSGL